METIDYFGKPKKDLKTLLSLLEGKYLIIEEIFESSEICETIFQDLLDILKWGYEYDAIRNKKIIFKFHRDDEKMFQLRLKNFVSNMLIWEQVMIMDKIDEIDETFIFDFTQKDYNDTFIPFLEDRLLSICELDRYGKNIIIDNIRNGIVAIAMAFSMLFGDGISIHFIIKMEEQNPELHEIMYSEIDDSLQPIEIEKILNERAEKLVEILRNCNNDLQSLLASGKILNQNQLKEIFLMVGYKADAYGNTIPILLKSGLLKDGLNDPVVAYIDAKSGRKSSVLIKNRMGEPGAFSKKLNNNTTPIILRKDYKSCDTIRPIVYHIKDDISLRLLNGRYYYTERGELKCLDYKKDKHLIGGYYRFRSPVTCTSKEGICHICYGKLYETNKDLFSVGGYAATKETEKIGQGYLSTKHTQFTKSSLIRLCDAFYKAFELTSNQITLRNDFDDDVYMSFENVQIEEMEDEVYYFTDKIKIIDSKGNIVFDIYDENGSEFYFSKELIQLYSHCKGSPIPLSLIEDDSTVLLFVEVKNREVTKPLIDLKDLLNKNNHLGCKTLDEICQKYLELKKEAGFLYDAVHHEIIIRSLVRKATNIMEFPDFSPTGDIEDYQFLKLDDALRHNPSPMISLTSGWLRKTLISPEFYRKDAPSHIDPMAMENIYGIRDLEDTKW